jgi:transcriptional regulator with XRE-family HTH domain
MSNSTDGLPTWTLADRLRKIRRDRHLTQEAIAKELGITGVAWAAWEAGRTRPRDVIELAAAIERRYGVPAAWTLGVLNSFDRRHQNVPTQQRRRWTDPPVTGRMMGRTA